MAWRWKTLYPVNWKISPIRVQRLPTSGIAGTILREHHSESSERNRRGEKINAKNSYGACACVAAATVGAYYLYSRAYALGDSKASSPGESWDANLKNYTAEQVGKHDNRESGIWITYKRGVYDVTEFASRHPGGSSKIMMAAGGSIEPFWQIFANHHTPEIYALLESMRIGNLDDNVDDATTLSSSSSSSGDDPYENEPKRHGALKINGAKPFCAEPPGWMLVETFLTPTDIYYVRNHLPVPKVDIESYELQVAIEDETKKVLNYETIKKYPKYTITTATMCGGNRRSEMARAKPLRGLGWGVGAVGNATWTGARLCDLLRDLDVHEDDWNHVQFEGLDVDPAGSPYGASIPIRKALDPRADVILAYEMNGRTISRDHGYPIRVIVPGVVGARNVKWLGKIIISKEESPSQWQRADYKAFSPSVDWDTVDFSTAPAIQEMPVVSAICTPESGQRVKLENGKIPIKGYAWSGGGNKIIRVDVTADGGKSWHVAKLVHQDPTAKEGRHWAWTIWSADIPVDETTGEIEIWAKAVDSSYNVQPETFHNIWNLRGFICNAYHRVKVRLDPILNDIT